MSTVLATAAVIATTGAAPAAEPASQPAAVPSVESVTERVLQSVDVTMAPDGTTTGVTSSVVRATDSVEDAETSDQSFSPEEVVGDLPVRVLTSWRTADGAGTDLSDLEGYDGRVAIDLTVQNLTVKPQTLQYDSAGTSREQAALVGSPLSVTASTALGDLKPERIVSDDKGSGVNVTNGVISKTAEGTTVQWAALLAPPVLSSSSEMSLVVDAKNFEVPSIDLSVQPGLVTDPSIGALVDAAFNPASSGELDLQRRTIELITDVNAVLANASDTISDVRSSLNSTSETLGTQTVSDLQSSTQSVTSNMRSLDGALQSLKSELDSTLKTTGSSALAEMQSAVDTVDQMLGDTSAQPVTAHVRGTGCETTVADPKQAGTVYGSLLQVAGQLKGYADATDVCKGAVKQSILDTIGTEQPTAEQCATQSPDQQSVTCLILGMRGTFEGYVKQIESTTNTALGLLNSNRYQGALDALNALKLTINGVDATDTTPGRIGLTEIAGLISQGRNGVVGSMNDAVFGPDRQPGGAVGTLQRAGAAVTNAQTQLGGLADEVAVLRANLDSMRTQAGFAAAQLCQAMETNAIDASKFNAALAALQGEDCDGKDLDNVDADGDGTVDAPLTARLSFTSEDLSALARVGAAVRRAQGALGAIDRAIGAPDDDTTWQPGDTTGLYSTLRSALDQRYNGVRFSELIDAAGTDNDLVGLSQRLDDQDDALYAALQSLEEDDETVNGLRVEIQQELASARAAMNRTLQERTDQAIASGQAASNELGTMLERSASGLSNSADTVVRNGRKSLEGQKQQFAKAQGQASNRISGTIEQGLSQINAGVSSSTRDMQAATTLLVADLRTVLLDLGERKVGGGGLLGAMTTSALTANAANSQLGLAGQKTTSYANVRGRDIDGLMLRQAQTEAAMQMLIDLPAFQLDLPTGSQHRTVYNFSIGEN